MPEGHSIHRLATRMGELFGGRVVRVSSPQGRFAAGASRLDGRVLTASRAHGKHLFLEFAASGDGSDVLVLRTHLGLYGAWSFAGDERFAAASSIGAPRKVGETETGSAADGSFEYDDAGHVIPDAPVGAVRARLVTAHGWADLRGPAQCVVETPAEARMVLDRLGPDPLVPGEDPAPFADAVGRSRRSIGVLLMEQHVIAGIGNIFRAESLFRCGIDPFREGRSLTTEELDALWRENVELMAVGVRLGKIVTTDPQHRPGVPEERAWPEHANYVYHRQGRPCLVCGTIVVRQDLNNRALYWCPGCQG